MDMPTGWTIATLAELGQWSSGGTPSRKNSAYFGGDIPWVLTGDLTDGPIYGVSNSITIAGLKESSAKVFPINTLLVAMYGATIGKLGTLRIEAATNQACAALLPNSANEETLPYAYYFLLSQRENLRKSGKGGAQPNISQTVLKEFPIPLAPKDEQVRIVEKIETLFTQLDQGEATLRSVQTLLTRYRQSVLKAAVTGQLTADWRAENAQRLEHGRDLLQRILQTRRDNWKGRGKYKEPAAPDTSDLPELPEGWVWASLDALITDGPTNGLSPKESSTDNAVPSFKLTATTSGTFVIDESTVKYVGADIPPNSKYWLQSGDILIQRGNTIDYVGTAAIFPGPNNKYIYPDLMIRIRVSFPELGIWLATWTNFEYAKRHFRRLATGTAGNMPKINGTTLKSLPVPIPSELEIQKINDEVAALESRYLHLVDSCMNELSRSTALRQSILKDAFAGRLVPQDPNDEPASALLARIRAEREAVTKPAARVRAKASSAKAVSQHAKGAR